MPIYAILGIICLICGVCILSGGLTNVIKEKYRQYKYFTDCMENIKAVESAIVVVNRAVDKLEKGSTDPAIQTKVSRIRAQTEMCGMRIRQLKEAIKSWDIDKAVALNGSLLKIREELLQIIEEMTEKRNEVQNRREA